MSIKRSISKILSGSDGVTYQCSVCRYRFEAPEDADPLCPGCESEDVKAM